MNEIEQRMTRGDDQQSIHIKYDAPFVAYHRTIARTLLKYVPAGKVLDFGCGTGHILKLLNEWPDGRLELVGADIDINCLNRTRVQARQATLVQLLPDPPFNLEGVGNEYDAILLVHVLEHIHEPISAIHNFLDLLSPNGYLILATPNPARPTVLLSNLWRRHYVNRGHIYAWDRSHWINFLENILQLDVVEYPTDEIRLFPNWMVTRFPPLQWLQSHFVKFIPWWSFSNIAVIRKAE